MSHVVNTLIKDSIPFLKIILNNQRKRLAAKIRGLYLHPQKTLDFG